VKLHKIMPSSIVFFTNIGVNLTFCVNLSNCTLNFYTKYRMDRKTNS